jgi:hypothetical protein
MIFPTEIPEYPIFCGLADRKMVGKAVGHGPSGGTPGDGQGAGGAIGQGGLAKAGWADERLSRTIKGHPGTVAIGRQMHRWNSPLPSQFVLPSEPTHTPIPQIDYSGEFND